jgi:hypothetical protein
VGDSNISQGDVRYEWLHVSELVTTRCRVTDVTDCEVSWKLGEVEVAKNIGYKTKTLVKKEVWVLGSVLFNRYYAGSLLAAVLLRVEPKIYQVRGLWVIPNSHETAFVVKRIVVKLHS